LESAGKQKHDDPGRVLDLDQRSHRALRVRAKERIDEMDATLASLVYLCINNIPA
jgi:hypothetical protein